MNIAENGPTFSPNSEAFGGQWWPYLVKILFSYSRSVHKGQICSYGGSSSLWYWSKPKISSQVLVTKRPPFETVVLISEGLKLTTAFKFWVKTSWIFFSYSRSVLKGQIWWSGGSTSMWYWSKPKFSSRGFVTKGPFETWVPFSEA